MHANEKATIYKSKVIHNWNEICTIYSKDNATSQGARTCVETEIERKMASPAQDANDISPQFVGHQRGHVLVKQFCACLEI